MDFRISDTFAASLSKVSGEEQKVVKTTAFDLQMDPSHSGRQFHKLDRARDKRFWSVRVSKDIRLIITSPSVGEAERISPEGACALANRSCGEELPDGVVQTDLEPSTETP